MQIKKEYFTINGKSYESFDAIPEEYKKLLDSDGNGKVDAFENLEDTKKSDVIQTRRVIHDVQEIGSRDGLPEYLKKSIKYQNYPHTLNRNRQLSPREIFLIIALMIAIGIIMYLAEEAGVNLESISYSISENT